MSGIRVQLKKQCGGFSLDVAFCTGKRRLGILGASGCGKSMTLKCIAGIETPDTGSISIDGRVLFDHRAGVDLRPQDRGVGYLFQSYALFPHMTAAQNIACALGVRGKSRRMEQARELLSRYGLLDLGQLYPSQLSGGQQQRVAICRMLAANPNVVLLDEPFSALDTHLREQLQIQMDRTLQELPHVILVTHSRDEAFRLCDELLILEDGGTVIQGNTRELFAQPRRLAAARLTGCKNISRILRTGERQVLAVDWNLSFCTAQPVEEGHTHIGIRAHDFVPVPAGEGDNLIIPHLVRRYEDPFEWNTLFVHRHAVGAGLQSIWWKHGKSGGVELPPALYAPPEKVLLLRE